MGVNIGKNKNSKDPVSDYKFLYNLVQPYADYVTINISSPNTPGLRDLQKKDKLEKILTTLSKFKKKKTFIKLSPDLSDKELEDICKLSMHSKIVDGLILTNTTISRKNLQSKPVRDFWKISEEGGLSGPPLKELSNKIIKKTYKLTKGKIILIGVGGISNGRDAFEKISCGCSLLQLYTSLVYKGPNVVVNILSELSGLLKKKELEKLKILWGKILIYERFIKLKSLKEIEDKYDIFFIDLWGVIHNGLQLFESIENVLNRLKKKIKLFFLLLMLPEDPLL